MRGLVAILPAIALAACLPAGDTDGRSLAPAPVTVTVLEEPAPQPEHGPEPAPEATPSPVTARPDPATAACTARGGSMLVGPAGIGRICVVPAPDAGRPCATARDCTGYCLARSLTCAPVTPLLGCHEVLISDGRRVAQCIQ